MGTTVFVASPTTTEEKTKLLDKLISICEAGGGKPGYFKTIVSKQDKERLDKYAAKLSISSEELYGLTLEEALTLLNEGKEPLAIEKVLEKFYALSSKFSCVPVEGADLDLKSTFGIQGLDGVLAANLKSPVVVVTACVGCLATGARYYRSNCAELISLVALGDFDAEKLKTLDYIGVPVISGASVEAISDKLPALTEKVSAFVPTVVTPKRFEYDLIERARSKKQRIVLPEGTDDRILEAANAIVRRDFAEIIILGDADAIHKRGKELSLDYLDKILILDLAKAPFRSELVSQLYELRKAKGMTEEGADTQLGDRNWFGTMMVKSGRADGMVSGAAGSTADTIRPALSIIKTRPGVSIASSVFLMCMKDKILVFGDCAIVTNPIPQQLAEIAISSAHTAKAFGVDPKVALLSYSSGTSGTGPDVDAVKEAVDIAVASIPKLYPGLPLDGPIQFDAALDEKTAKSKMPGSPVAGKATVLIFPTLNAGNIGYKAVQRTSGAVAVGPIIQGLNAPVNDLSRGCTVPDIINTVAITACQAQAK
ncbi:MAG: phosphate acetyltransferase [Deltaproteobacteria bacterium]|jgi:phosphate acetyltransferase|nr:phosphate acetyltransferase [Deltaproteobacteria bacterium]